MKLFQIEEPEGGPTDPSAAGAPVGIDVSGVEAEVATSVGGNAAVLADRHDFERPLAVPPTDAAIEEWQGLFEAARLRAERALARPVTHAVVVLGAPPNSAVLRLISAAADQAGLAVLRIVTAGGLISGVASVLAAAILAEDLAPRSDAELR